MTEHKATPGQWKSVERYPTENAACACILELRARIKQLEAQANHSPGATKMVPPPVATDEELRGLWYAKSDFLEALRILYNLGVAHGQAGSREVAEPALVAGGDMLRASLMADLGSMIRDATEAGQLSDAQILRMAAAMLMERSELVPAKGGDPAPVPVGLVERVSDAITSETGSRWASTEARAAILEVARWLREQRAECSADLLEQEAGR